jgi:hypothetical protein
MRDQVEQVVTIRRPLEVREVVLFGLLHQEQQRLTTQLLPLMAIGEELMTMIKKGQVVVELDLFKSLLLT